ncbi:MAG: MliC family protein [Moraxella sp.]|nr:MliC family protein [Moraxella sp.]
MKTALIAGLALSALTLSACSTNKADTPNNKPSHTIKGERGDGVRHDGKRGERGEHREEKRHDSHDKGRDYAHQYQCDNGAAITAKYNPRAGNAVINVTAPSLSLNNQDIEMKHARSGSGMRFVNDTNPASLYEWHTKGAEGLLTVNVGGTAYELQCQGEARPTMPQDRNHQGM